MKENNFEKIQEEFKTYIQNKEEVRIFVFKDKGNREHYSVLEFEEIISREYHEYFNGNVKVFVYDKYYTSMLLYIVHHNYLLFSSCLVDTL